MLGVVSPSDGGFDGGLRRRVRVIGGHEFKNRWVGGVCLDHSVSPCFAAAR